MRNLYINTKRGYQTFRTCIFYAKFMDISDSNISLKKFHHFILKLEIKKKKK